MTYLGVNFVLARGPALLRLRATRPSCGSRGDRRGLETAFLVGWLELCPAARGDGLKTEQVCINY